MRSWTSAAEESTGYGQFWAGSDGPGGLIRMDWRGDRGRRAHAGERTNAAAQHAALGRPQRGSAGRARVVVRQAMWGGEVDRTHPKPAELISKDPASRGTEKSAQMFLSVLVQR